MSYDTPMGGDDWGSTSFEPLPTPVAVAAPQPPLIVLAVSGVGGFAGVDISPQFLLYPHPPLEVCVRVVGGGVCWPLPLGGWYLPRAARVTCVIR